MLTPTEHSPSSVAHSLTDSSVCTGVELWREQQMYRDINSSWISSVLRNTGQELSCMEALLGLPRNSLAALVEPIVWGKVALPRLSPGV